MSYKVPAAELPDGIVTMIEDDRLTYAALGFALYVMVQVNKGRDKLCVMRKGTSSVKGYSKLVQELVDLGYWAEDEE